MYSSRAGTARVPDLADEEFHEVVWRRNARGEMTVRIDGDLALAVRDDGFRDGFSGFSVINGGGEWQLDEVTVRAAGG